MLTFNTLAHQRYFFAVSQIFKKKKKQNWVGHKPKNWFLNIIYTRVHDLVFIYCEPINSDTSPIPWTAWCACVDVGVTVTLDISYFIGCRKYHFIVYVRIWKDVLYKLILKIDAFISTSCFCFLTFFFFLQIMCNFIFNENPTFSSEWYIHVINIPQTN